MSRPERMAQEERTPTERREAKGVSCEDSLIITEEDVIKKFSVKSLANLMIF